MQPTPERRAALARFAEREFAAGLVIEPASADASFRSYWRVGDASGSTRVVMDAPPAQENIGPWLDIGARLGAVGLHVPRVFAVDREQGFVLMEDLGSHPYLPALDERSADTLYADALDALLRIQTAADPSGLPVFDAAFVRMELDLMPLWFLERHLGHAPEDAERSILDAAFAALEAAIREQPQGFMHRDFHSRNLMVVERVADSSGKSSTLVNPGLIDFQGAVIGPITYDLASLLRDCYIAWDPARVDEWLEGYGQRALGAHLIGTEVDPATWRRWFDLTGLQRHLKVLGLFCRLWYRDGKAGYLADLPLVWRYVIDVAQRYAELAPLARLLERAVGGRDITRPAGPVA